MPQSTDRKPYAPTTINPNYDSPVAQMSRQIEIQRAERAAQAILRLKRDKTYRPAPKHVPATIEKECVGSEGLFMPHDQRETHCTFCDALEAIA